MERREFCRFLGVCGVTACAGGLTGCARALTWSEQRHAEAVTREFGGAPASVEATGTAAAPTYPDLAVAIGDDPASNTRTAIEMLGGIERFVKPGARVVVKPNILTARAPEYGVTTNPAAVAEVVKLCLAAGAASVTAFDRPTGPIEQCYEVSGIRAAVEEAGGIMKVLSDRDFENVVIPQGRVLTSWPLLKDVFEADVMINMPCTKTHGLAGLTLSMKNLMGIMGDTRGLIHQDIAQKLVDVNTLIRPHLVVLDAFRLLWRNGPTGGGLEDVKPGRTCVAGTSQVSVDAYGATLLGWQPMDLEYVRLAVEQGLGVADLGSLRVETRGA